MIEVENGSPSPSVTGVRASARESERLAALSERAALSADRRSDGASEDACASRANASALRASAWGNSIPDPRAAELVSSCASGALSTRRSGRLCHRHPANSTASTATLRRSRARNSVRCSVSVSRSS